MLCRYVLCTVLSTICYSHVLNTVICHTVLVVSCPDALQSKDTFASLSTLRLSFPTVTVNVPCFDPPDVEQSASFSEMSEQLAFQYWERYLEEEERAYLPWSGKHYRSVAGSSFHDGTTVRSSVCMPYGEWTYIDNCAGILLLILLLLLLLLLLIIIIIQIVQV